MKILAKKFEKVVKENLCQPIPKEMLEQDENSDDDAPSLVLRECKRQYIRAVKEATVECFGEKATAAIVAQLWIGNYLPVVDNPMYINGIGNDERYQIFIKNASEFAAAICLGSKFIVNRSAIAMFKKILFSETNIVISKTELHELINNAFPGCEIKELNQLPNDNEKIEIEFNGYKIYMDVFRYISCDKVVDADGNLNPGIIPIDIDLVDDALILNKTLQFMNAYVDKIKTEFQDLNIVAANNAVDAFISSENQTFADLKATIEQLIDVKTFIPVC